MTQSSLNHNGRVMIFAGNANPSLAARVAEHLKIRPGYCVVGRFSDGEVLVEIDDHVRGQDVLPSSARQRHASLPSFPISVMPVRTVDHARSACRSPPSSSPT